MLKRLAKCTAGLCIRVFGLCVFSTSAAVLLRCCFCCFYLLLLLLHIYVYVPRPYFQLWPFVPKFWLELRLESISSGVLKLPGGAAHRPHPSLPVAPQSASCR